MILRDGQARPRDLTRAGSERDLLIASKGFPLRERAASPYASDRYHRSTPGHPAAESPSVFSVPTTAHNRYFTVRAAERKKKKGKEKSFYRSRRKRRSYNRHEHRDHVSRRRGSLTATHARCTSRNTYGNTRGLTHIATSLPCNAVNLVL